MVCSTDEGLTLFGLFAVTAMLVCYAFEKRSFWFVLAFALSGCTHLCAARRP
jgi:hypothetical protein